MYNSCTITLMPLLNSTCHKPINQPNDDFPSAHTPDNMFQRFEVCWMSQRWLHQLQHVPRDQTSGQRFPLYTFQHTTFRSDWSSQSSEINLCFNPQKIISDSLLCFDQILKGHTFIKLDFFSVSMNDHFLNFVLITNSTWINSSDFDINVPQLFKICSSI